ncbi:MAG: methylated-DNA--[protein]-cysteine S-methyltransferase [Proteobacteria bacterium]|nr:methylated-DNA--[protein]-cysteine S-methyltransferase [Pseudomonadota bacterium]
MWFDSFQTPIGTLTVAADTVGLRYILFPTNAHDAPGRESWVRNPEPLREARRQLQDYFHGKRRRFDLPLAPVGTPFQIHVWTTLAAIPFGTTWSYRDLAAQVGKPTATRAVGAANGRNPLPIVLPCHRVIGADGSLTGFGGGLPIKRFLLEHEGALARPRAAWQSVEKALSCA